jgi:microcystin-dependent protein
MIVLYSGATLPDGWLLCDGSTIDTNTYDKLYAVLGSDTLPTLTEPAPGVGYIIKY